MEDIIIWGAGKKAVQKIEWAVFAGYHVLFFVDNALDKWGEIINNVPIYSPEVLKGYKCPILIPDAYVKEITAQLELISYQGSIIGFRQFKKEAVCREDINIDFSKAQINDKTSFIFDSYLSGMNWGGAESWSCMISNQLDQLGIRTQVLCGANDKFDRFSSHCQHFYNNDELSLVKEMAQKIVAYLPCVFLSIASIALYAARIVKTLFPDQIQIILVAHNDRKGIYENFEIWSDKVDKIVCISNKIQLTFQERYKVKKDILVYHPNPISVSNIHEKRMFNTGTLKIGFAARLAKTQKRANLLTEVIEACMKRNFDVEFNIAGEGDCSELLKAYVSDTQLEDKVHIIGWIPPVDMADFWSKQDIYLNISDFEGMSLAMLEAMASGVVPVVTDVSGVSDVIRDGENGFVVSVDNWIDVVDKIEALNYDRELLHRISSYNMKFVKEKFNVADYAEWMIKTFHFTEQ